jgi:hypothetical protein
MQKYEAQLVAEAIAAAQANVFQLVRCRSASEASVRVTGCRLALTSLLVLLSV